jgi:hypothetical protein
VASVTGGPEVIRLFLAIFLVVLLAMFWFELMPAGRTFSAVTAAAVKFSKCIDEHSDEINSAMRGSGDTSSYNDFEYNQYRANSIVRDIQSACINESGFKDVVSRTLDQIEMSDSEKVSIRKDLADAHTIDDMERIEKRIETESR